MSLYRDLKKFPGVGVRHLVFMMRFTIDNMASRISLGSRFNSLIDNSLVLLLFVLSLDIRERTLAP